MGIFDKHPNYRALRDIISEKRSPIVFWVGAGASADAGLPTWGELRSYLCDAAEEELVTRPKTEADALEPDLETARNTTDLWSAFEKVRGILDEPTYKGLIRAKLETAETVAVPEIYNRIWSLDAVAGIVTLNLDGLEERAHRTVRTQESVDVFVGRDLKDHVHTIKRRKPFIARLHGVHTERASWVFTESELGRLIRDPAYGSSVNTLFSNFTVVFLGISADDVAAGGFLQKLTELGVDAGNHYWITDRNDSGTNHWTAAAGIRKIPYSLEGDESHTRVLADLFEDMASYRSYDSVAPAISYSGAAVGSLPDLQELRTIEEDDVRNVLNAHAKHLLDVSEGDTDNSEYQDFLDTYSPAIHQSWHLSLAQGYNRFFGYEAVEKIHSGAFSNVWKVRNSKGAEFALKTIQLDNLRKGPQLESFRRGVESQRMLKDLEAFDGFAKIEDAFEIPPSVIMEFVPGENLAEVSQHSSFDFWTEGVLIAANLCRVTMAAHNSPFGILHRDVRPTNIMVPYYYFGDAAPDYGWDAYTVKLLNYDLVWHKDAAGKVIATDATDAGYYAPEQLEEESAKVARDVRVDSYGIGMTLFYLAAGCNPPVGGSKSTEWQSYLQLIRPSRNTWFKPAHNVVKRVIEQATDPDVAKRLTISEIESRLADLYGVLTNGVEMAPIEFLGETLIHSAYGDLYESNPGGTVFRVENAQGRRFEIGADRTKRKLTLLFANPQTGSTNWKKIDKNWSAHARDAKEILASGGWKILPESGYTQRVITLAADAHIDDIRSQFDKLEDTLMRAIQKVRLD